MNNHNNSEYISFRDPRYLYAKCICDLLDRRDFFDEQYLMDHVHSEEKMKLLLLKTVERMPALQGEAVIEDMENINREDDSYEL